MENYYPFCKHCLGLGVNEIGENIAFCEEWDLWRNVTLGECFGNCEDQKVVCEKTIQSEKLDLKRTN